MRIPTVLTVIGGILLSTSLALAGAMDIFIGNTLVVGVAPDAQMRIYSNEDGTYTGTLPDGTAISGDWTEDGDTICFIRKTPNEQAPICNEIANVSVGDTWSATGLDGAELTLTLVKGR